MGLPICRTICEAHGGTLNAANHPDGGAEFVIAMPSAPPA
jgi:signal transduction histidine kinase